MKDFDKIKKSKTKINGVECEITFMSKSQIHTKSNSKWIKNLNGKTKNYKTFQTKYRGNLHDNS